MIIKDANKAKEVIGVSLTDDVHLKFERAWWIWAKASEYNCNHWINVRKCFDAPLGAEEAKLHISVDTDYCVWLNGVLVGQGQFSDFPEVKTYDVIDVGKYIKQGKNCLGGFGLLSGDKHQQI